MVEKRKQPWIHLYLLGGSQIPTLTYRDLKDRVILYASTYDDKVKCIYTPSGLNYKVKGLLPLTLEKALKLLDNHSLWTPNALIEVYEWVKLYDPLVYSKVKERQLKKFWGGKR